MNKDDKDLFKRGNTSNNYARKKTSFEEHFNICILMAENELFFFLF